MEEIRKFLETSLRITLVEIQDEEILFNEMHDIGHVRSVGMIEAWVNDRGATKENVFDKALKEYERLDAFMKKEDESFRTGKDSLVFTNGYRINDGKKCMLYGFLKHFEIIVDEDVEWGGSCSK